MPLIYAESLHAARRLQLEGVQYWRPAARTAADLGIKSPLGAAVVYGSFAALGEHGAEVSRTALAATPQSCHDGPQPGTRSLALQTPLARGLDVRLVQLGLSERGVNIKADGIFGQTSVALLKSYQASHGLPVNGVADPLLISQLLA